LVVGGGGGGGPAPWNEKSEKGGCSNVGLFKEYAQTGTRHKSYKWPARQAGYLDS
jgi:hypothetical protein